MVSLGAHCTKSNMITACMSHLTACKDVPQLQVTSSRRIVDQFSLQTEGVDKAGARIFLLSVFSHFNIDVTQKTDHSISH